MKHKISIFSGKNANQTAIASDTPEVSWNELGQLITTSLWAPGTFTDNHRTIKNFEQMTVLGLDIDGGCSIQDARNIFRDYTYIIAPSRNHQKEKVLKSGKVLPPCDRFRILIPLSEPIVTDDDFKATWHQALALCPDLDPACKDSSRFYYPSTSILFTNDGETFPVSKAKPKLEKAVEVSLAKEGANLPLSKRTRKFLESGAPDGQWHVELVAACMDLKQQKWSKEMARLKCMAITGHLDAHDEETIEDVYENRDAKHEPRGEYREPLRRRILSCHMIANQKQLTDTKMVDLSNGRVYPIHRAMVELLLSRDEFGSFMKNNYVPADFTYNPHILGCLTQDEGGCYIYNSYIPPKWKEGLYFKGETLAPVTELPDIYERFFTHLTGGHVESKEYLIDWLATSLQSRNFTILTAIGDQGIGKGVLAEIMKGMHGYYNYSECRDSILKERFNGKMENKTLVYIDEVSLPDKESHDRMKTVVNVTLEIEKKGVDSTTIDNHASFYITSNAMDAVKLEAGDRRFSIIQLTETKLNLTPLFNELASILDEGNVGALARYLYQKKVERDMSKPFRSPRFVEVQTAGLTDWELWILDEYVPSMAGGTPTVKDAQEKILDNKVAKIAPGWRKFQALSKKFPDMFRLRQRKEDGARILEVPREPKGFKSELS